MDRLEYQRRLVEAARSQKLGRAVSLPTVQAPVSQGDGSATARAKGKRKGDPRGPRPPSTAQWGKLRMELEARVCGPSERLSQSEILAWVRFANAYWPGPYFSLHFIEAIDLIMTDRNTYGTGWDLIAFSMGEDLPPPDLRRRIAGFKKAARSRR